MAQAQDETPDKRTPGEITSYWQEQLDLAEKDTKELWDDADKVIARYKGGREGPRQVRTKKLNILYSNTEVLKSALYGKSAKPDVRRRFGLEDAAGGQVAEIIEKSLVYCAESYDSDKPIQLGLHDYLLAGRGIVRIEYEPVFGNDPTTGQQFITDQHLYEKYVYWKDFLCMPARTWDDVLNHGWVSFRHRMTRSDLLQNFGNVGRDAPLNWQPEVTNKKEAPESLRKAEVYEIWDATDRKRYWIVKGFDKPLRVDDDPYGLESFFPMAEPPAQYLTTDSIVPSPEFHVYQDQADDLDEITGRISKLTRALKRRGVYDQSVKELSRLANANDNQFIPVENYQALATRGGLAAAFQSEDISIIASVLVQLYQQRDMLVQAIWEQVGIADIMRGQSRASETLGAQQLKAQFGSQRLQRRQRAIQRWVRDLLKLKAEIIAEHYEPQVIQQMTGIQVTPEAMQILRTDKLRSYRIDIETDSTVFEDAEEEKKSRGELIKAVTSFIQGWGPIVQQAPPLGPVAFELLRFGLGGFKATRQVEDAIEQAASAFAQQAQQPKPPSPEEQKLQAEQQSAQAELQLKAQELQMKAQAEQQKMATQAQAEQQRLQQDQERHAAEMQMKREEMALKREEMALKAQIDQQKAAQDSAHAERDQQFKEKEFNLKAQDFVSKEHDRMREGTKVDNQGAIESAIPEAAKSMTDATKALPQVAEALAAVTERLHAITSKAAAPRRRIPIRNDAGDIIEVQDAPIEG